MDTESFNLFKLVPDEWLERGTNFHTIDDSHASNKSVQYIEFARKIFPGFSSFATTFGTALDLADGREDAPAVKMLPQ